MTNNIENINNTASYSLNRQRSMTPKEFKKYFYAHRKINCEQNIDGFQNITSASCDSFKKSEKANGKEQYLKKNISDTARLTSKEGMLGKAETIVRNLELITRNSDIVNKTKKTAVEWIAVDSRELRGEGEKKKIPFLTMLLILTVSVALLLVVAGTVITSQASMDLRAMENELEEMNEYKEELEQKIEIKNDLKLIEMIARTELGMVDREYAAVKYIGEGAVEKVVIYDTPKESSIIIGLSTLLSALGFPGLR